MYTKIPKKQDEKTGCLYSLNVPRLNVSPYKKNFQWRNIVDTLNKMIKVNLTRNET